LRLLIRTKLNLNPVEQIKEAWTKSHKISLAILYSKYNAPNIID